MRSCISTSHSTSASKQAAATSSRHPLCSHRLHVARFTSNSLLRSNTAHAFKENQVVNSSKQVQGRDQKSDISALLGLVQWAIANKIQFTGCRPDIKSGVRGVYATSACRAGDLLVAVPLQAALFVRPGERCPFPDFIPQPIWAKLPWFAQLACKLLHEQSHGSASRFADYLPALPTRVDLPALWPAEHVTHLQYPYLEEKILAEEREWAQLYDTLAPHLASRRLSRQDLFWALACVRSRTFAGPHLPTPPAVKLAAGAVAALVVASTVAGLAQGVDVAAGGGSTATVAVAAAAAVAAGLGVPVAWQGAEVRRAQEGGVGTELFAMCPFIDMFNHDSRSKSECVFDPWRLQFVVAAAPVAAAAADGNTNTHSKGNDAVAAKAAAAAACGEIRPGQQLLLNYGSQSNDALLQRYGFVQPMDDNPYDRYVLQGFTSKLERVLLAMVAVELKAVETEEEGAGKAAHMVYDTAQASQAAVEIRAAVQKLREDLQGEGLLGDQVMITASGFPPPITQAVASLRVGLLARCKSGTSPLGQHSPQQHDRAVSNITPEAVLARVCAEELGATATTLEEDEAALAQLEAWEAAASAAEDEAKTRTTSAAAAAEAKVETADKEASRPGVMEDAATLSSTLGEPAVEHRATIALATAAALGNNNDSVNSSGSSSSSSCIMTVTEATGVREASLELTPLPPPCSESHIGSSAAPSGTSLVDPPSAAEECCPTAPPGLQVVAVEEPVELQPPAELGGEVEKLRTVLAFRIAK
ncbi:hypothetical protein Agub_g15162, partial [Astrephomene gubernaculifera]